MTEGSEQPPQPRQSTSKFRGLTRQSTDPDAGIRVALAQRVVDANGVAEPQANDVHEQPTQRWQRETNGTGPRRPRPNRLNQNGGGQHTAAMPRESRQRQGDQIPNQNETFQPSLAVPLDKLAGRVGAVLGVALDPGVMSVLSTSPSELNQNSIITKELITIGSGIELAGIYATATGNEFGPFIWLGGAIGKLVARANMEIEAGSPENDPFKKIREEHTGVQVFEKTAEVAVRILTPSILSKPELHSKITAIRRNIGAVAELAVPVVTYALTKDLGTALDSAIIMKACTLAVEGQDYLSALANKVSVKAEELRDKIYIKLGKEKPEGTPLTRDEKLEVNATLRHNAAKRREFEKNMTFNQDAINAHDQREFAEQHRREGLAEDAQFRQRFNEADEKRRVQAQLVHEAGNDRKADRIVDYGATVRLDQPRPITYEEQARRDQVGYNGPKSTPELRAFVDDLEQRRLMKEAGFHPAPQERLGEVERAARLKQREEKRARGEGGPIRNALTRLQNWLGGNKNQPSPEIPDEENITLPRMREPQEPFQQGQSPVEISPNPNEYQVWRQRAQRNLPADQFTDATKRFAQTGQMDAKTYNAGIKQKDQGGVLDNE